MASRLAARLRKSVNAATIELNEEELEEKFSARKTVLANRKLIFFGCVVFSQLFDAFSDVAAEGKYFFSRDGGGETADGELAPMGYVFDACYAVHGIASICASGYILQKVFAVALHMLKARRRKKVQSSGGASDASGDGASTTEKARGAASKSTKRSWKKRSWKKSTAPIKKLSSRLVPNAETGEVDQAVHRAAAQLQGEEANDERAAGVEGNRRQQANQGDGVSVRSQFGLLCALTQSFSLARAFP